MRVIVPAIESVGRVRPPPAGGEAKHDLLALPLLDQSQGAGVGRRQGGREAQGGPSVECVLRDVPYIIVQRSEYNPTRMNITIMQCMQAFMIAAANK